MHGAYALQLSKVNGQELKKKKNQALFWTGQCEVRGTCMAGLLLECI